LGPDLHHYRVSTSSSRTRLHCRSKEGQRLDVPPTPLYGSKLDMDDLHGIVRSHTRHHSGNIRLHLLSTSQEEAISTKTVSQRYL
jgi:hypothetical protein